MPQQRSSSSSINSTFDEGLVHQLRLSNCSKFTALVHMHLSFLLDLSGTCLSELIEDRAQSATATDQVDRAPAIVGVFSKKKPSKDGTKQMSIFGHPLGQSAIDRISLILSFLADPENVKQEGLFRKAGNVDRQRVLCDHLSSDNMQLNLHKEFTVHDCATVLKSFLGDMPEPLLVEKYCTAYRQVAEMQSDVKRLQALQLLVLLLPVEHSTLLRRLLSLLQRVTDEPENRMTADNLAILFVPHIIVPRKTPTAELQKTYACLTGLVSFMISHASELFTCPESLMRDVILQYQCLNCDGASSVTQPEHEESSWTSDTSATTKPSSVEYDDEVIMTSVGFADRQASLQAAVEFDTDKAIADLYAHVAQMPDSACKRRLMKQFTRSTTPKRRKFPEFTSSIKRIIKRHRCRDDSAVFDVNCETSELRTPEVKKLFVNDDASVTSSCLQSTDRSDAVRVSRLLDSRVTDDDVTTEVTDDEWCSSDKENDTVFPFHHTPSVIAMERIFAKQRLPNFVRPKGYISPLRCPH